MADNEQIKRMQEALQSRADEAQAQAQDEAEAAWKWCQRELGISDMAYPAFMAGWWAARGRPQPGGRAWGRK